MIKISDYIFPNILAKALKRPSQRTTMEATLIGLTGFILCSLGTAIYLMFFTNMSIFFKITTGLGEICLFLLLGSQLATSYLQYYFFKKSMGLYSKDEELIQKVDEAKMLIKDLDELVRADEFVQKCNKNGISDKLKGGVENV